MCYRLSLTYFCIFVRISNNMGNYFADFSSASGGFAPDPHRGSAPGPRWGTSVLQTPWFAPQPWLSSDATEPHSSVLLPLHYCGLGAGSIPFRAIVNNNQCEMRGLFMSLVIHYWIDLQDSQGVSSSEMTYIVSGGGVKLYSLTRVKFTVKIPIYRETSRVQDSGDFLHRHLWRLDTPKIWRTPPNQQYVLNPKRWCPEAKSSISVYVRQARFLI